MSEAVSRDAIGADSSQTSTFPAKAATLIANANVATHRFDVPVGGVIYEPDTPAKSVYLLHAGQVRILLLTPRKENQAEDERAVLLLEILGPGDWFGMQALTSPGSRYETRAVAVTPVTASEVPAERLFETLPQQPQMAESLIRTLALRAQSAYAGAAKLVFADTNERLITTLLDLSRTAAATEQEDERVELRMTHQEIAQAIGAARETVSLALTQLRQKKVLQTGRNRLFFNRDVLQNFYQAQSTPSGGNSQAEPQPSGQQS